VEVGIGYVDGCLLRVLGVDAEVWLTAEQAGSRGGRGMFLFMLVPPLVDGDSAKLFSVALGPPEQREAAAWSPRARTTSGGISRHPYPYPYPPPQREEESSPATNSPMALYAAPGGE
jgi:hypothetical protein